MKVAFLAVALATLVSGFTAPIRPTFVGRSSPSALSATDYDFALLFDCDGVIIETEELHRLAYNAAFDAAKLTIDGEPVVWSVEYYDMLQNTGKICAY